MSHSSHYKPLLRELRSCLPEHIDAWIDENRLLIGEDISASLEQAITTNSDFVVLFVDAVATRSPWVKREVEWALAAEQRTGRTFLLPVVLDKEAWEAFEPAELRKRKYLTCLDFTEQGVRTLADGISGALFSWLSRDLERSRAADEKEDNGDILGDADRFLRSVAAEIRTVVHPHRRENPLEVESLYERLHGLSQVADLTPDQFFALLTRLEQQNLLVGLAFDGDEIYVEEEHYSWKLSSFTDAKKRISRAAARLVHTGDTIALDAGSTTEAIAERLARALKLHRLRNLTVITNSLPAASELLAATNDLGLDDTSDLLKVFLAGGRIRVNTLAIVAVGDDAGSELRRYIDASGGADLAFVGTNGICEDGFTTEAESEAQTKRALLEHARRKFVVTDPSKFGVRQSVVFSGFDGINLLTTADGYEEIIDTIKPGIVSAGGELVLS